MTLEELRQKHRRSWWLFSVRGALALAVAFFILLRPLDSLAVLALIVAIWAVVTGVAEIVHALHVKDSLESWWIWLAGGVFSVAFGAAALYYYPLLSLAFMVTWAALWFLVSGSLGIYGALQLRRSGLPWGWPFLWGVLGALLSIVTWFNAPATLLAILVLLAVYAFLSGVALLTAAWRIRALPARLATLHPDSAA
jgi:uncharacterized membrane protein HdeD (DUF308 family)